MMKNCLMPFLLMLVACSGKEKETSISEVSSKIENIQT